MSALELKSTSMKAWKLNVMAPAVGSSVGWLVITPVFGEPGVSKLWVSSFP